MEHALFDRQGHEFNRAKERLIVGIVPGCCLHGLFWGLVVDKEINAAACLAVIMSEVVFK